MLFWTTPGLNGQIFPVTRQEFCPLNSRVIPFYLVPDEDRGWDPDDLTAQEHLGTSDVPDVLGGRHYGRTLLAGALADLGDGLLPAALGAQAGSAQLAAAGVGDAVAAAHRVAALAHAHGEGRGTAGCCPGFTLPPLAALHALHARRAVPPAGRAAPARLTLAASTHRAAPARVAGLTQRAAEPGQRGAGGRHARAAGIRRGGRGEGQEQEQEAARRRRRPRGRRRPQRASRRPAGERHERSAAAVAALGRARCPLTAAAAARSKMAAWLAFILC